MSLTQVSIPSMPDSPRIFTSPTPKYQNNNERNALVPQSLQKGWQECNARTWHQCLDLVKVVLKTDPRIEKFNDLPDIRLEANRVFQLTDLGLRANQSRLARFLRVLQSICHLMHRVFINTGIGLACFSLIGGLADRTLSLAILSVVGGLALGLVSATIGYAFKIQAIILEWIEFKWKKTYFTHTHADPQIMSELEILRKWCHMKDLNGMARSIQEIYQHILNSQLIVGVRQDLVQEVRKIEVMNCKIFAFSHLLGAIQERPGGPEVLAYLHA
jgi:hypothetical protein